MIFLILNERRQVIKNETIMSPNGIENVHFTMPTPLRKTASNGLTDVVNLYCVMIILGSMDGKSDKDHQLDQIEDGENRCDSFVFS